MCIDDDSKNEAVLRTTVYEIDKSNLVYLSNEV